MSADHARWLAALALTFISPGCLPKAETPLPSQLAEMRPGAHTLVVVHSRSGNTARVARAMARELGADYVRLSVPPGSGDGFWSTPNRHKQVDHTPLLIDLGPYDQIFLGCPIWYWRPTAFMYSFIKRQDLRGKRVVLFFTYESSLSKNAVSEWTSLVESRGGRVTGVLPFDRRKTSDADLETAAARAASSFDTRATPHVR